ncbi:hypothetical protein ACTFIY_009610 [Dictyostelium cf. discoideum]
MIPHMGAIYGENGEDVGTCTCISANLVLVAYHTVAVYSQLLNHLSVAFGSDRYIGFKSIIEADPHLDYAIIELESPLQKSHYPVLNNPSQDFLGELTLLHYPLGKELQISSHTSTHQIQYEELQIETFHDSDYGSSGGAYIDSRGYLTAIHLGSSFNGDRVHLQRKALTIREIIQNNSESIINHFITGQSQQNLVIHSPSVPTYPQSVSSFDEEGAKSQAHMKQLLTPYLNRNSLLYDNKLKLVKVGISFSEANMAHIKSRYPTQLTKCIEASLYHTGLHSETKLFSILKGIESDHLIPHDVWKSTDHLIMKAIAQGRGKRAGENKMPAITIPYDKHRYLDTTINADFRRKITKLCDIGLVDEAIIECFQAYIRAGIRLGANGITKTIARAHLEEYVKLQLIKPTDKEKIIDSVYHNIIPVVPRAQKIQDYYENEFNSLPLRYVLRKKWVEDDLNEQVTHGMITQQQKSAKELLHMLEIVQSIAPISEYSYNLSLSLVAILYPPSSLLALHSRELRSYPIRCFNSEMSSLNYPYR